MVTVNEDMAVPSSTGIVDMNRVGLEGLIANQVNFKQLLGQWRSFDSKLITPNLVVGSDLFRFSNSISASTFISEGLLFGIAQQFFHRCRYDVEYLIHVQGMKQTQGALILSYSPTQIGSVQAFYRSGRFRSSDIGNMMRLPYRIISFMSPSSTHIKVPYNIQMPMRPMYGHDTKDFVEQVGANLRIDPYHFIGNDYLLTVLDPLRTADGVNTQPLVQIWVRLTNIEFGVYQPRNTRFPVT